MQALATSPTKFFALTVVLSLPFWLAGSLTTWQPLPGVPVSALMFLCPGIAATVLIAREHGSVGVGSWLSGAMRGSGRRGFFCWPVALLLPPSVGLISYALMLSLHLPLPRIEMDFGRLPLVFLVLLVSGVFEQLGWSAYAVDALQRRRSALSTGLLVGLIWAVWHVVPLLQAGRSVAWIAWWCLMTVSLRVVLSWLYNSAGRSVLVVAVCQAAANTSWQFFPNYGSHYDPGINGLVWLAIAILVVVLGGPGHLHSPSAR